MSYTAREWSQNYDTAKKKLYSYKTQGRNPYSASDLNQLVATVKSLDLQLKTMTSNPLEFEICSSELARRRVLLDNLQNLLNFGSISQQTISSSSGPVGSSASSSATYNPINNSTSNSGLQQRQHQVIQQQDTMLVDLGKNMDTLQNQAAAIGDESKL